MSDARQELERILAEIAPTISGIDLAAGDAAQALASAHPFPSPGMGRIRELCAIGIDEGWLVPREAGPGVRFGRLLKEVEGFVVDCVLMEGAAKGHTHPRGEVNIAFAWEGDPRFDGRPEGWIVYPPGSHHVPTVTDGQMLFVYFLPGGEVVWDA